MNKKLVTMILLICSSCTTISRVPNSNNQLKITSVKVCGTVKEAHDNYTIIQESGLDHTTKLILESRVLIGLVKEIQDNPNFILCQTTLAEKKSYESGIVSEYINPSSQISYDPKTSIGDILKCSPLMDHAGYLPVVYRNLEGQVVAKVLKGSMSGFKNYVTTNVSMTEDFNYLVFANTQDTKFELIFPKNKDVPAPKLTENFFDDASKVVVLSNKPTPGEASYQFQDPISKVVTVTSDRCVLSR